MRQLENSPITVSGLVEPEFETVRESFLGNFDQGREIGAAVVVYHRGRLVVDLAGGLRDRVSSKRYSHETLQPVFSATKGITALAANMLADRGQLDLDAPVASYWPEFAQAGKSDVPVRWLLTHQSGVLRLDQAISLEQLLDWNLVVELLAAQAPDWQPGSQHGYHSMTWLPGRRSRAPRNRKDSWAACSTRDRRSTSCRSIHRLAGGQGDERCSGPAAGTRRAAAETS